MICNMRKWYYIVIGLFLQMLVLNGLAQNPKVEALKVEYITQKLNLSEAESKSFWPLYNDFLDKEKAIRKSYRQAMNNLPADFSDERAKEIINLEIQVRQAELDLEKLFNEKLKAIIGIKKLAMLKQAEFEFKRKVLEAVNTK